MPVFGPLRPASQHGDPYTSLGARGTSSDPAKVLHEPDDMHYMGKCPYIGGAGPMADENIRAAVRILRGALRATREKWRGGLA